MKRAFPGTANKHDIAVAIADRFPELAPRLPRVRKPWMSEDYRMSIFDAVGLALISGAHVQSHLKSRRGLEQAYRTKFRRVS